MTAVATSILVVGIGNEFRGDDGAGLTAARRLRTRLPADIPILEQTGEGGALLEAWQGVASVVLLDAVKSGAPPGTIHRFNANGEEIPREYFQHSTHKFSVAEAVELARVLGRLPARLMIYGIEGESFEMAVRLSGPVEQAVETVVREVAYELAVLVPRDPDLRFR